MALSGSTRGAGAAPTSPTSRESGGWGSATDVYKGSGADKNKVLNAERQAVGLGTEGLTFDFDNDPIRTHIDGGWVRAEGTTLGADCGIGMAAALAVMIDPAVQHGPV